jgi:murein DD-endopeptidase MepM/ murein hydrolase activator NlpD
MPRGDTDQPRREVNARIFRPDTSGADELSHLLGLAADVGGKIVAQDQERRDERDAGAAALDFAADSQNADKFKKSRAYRDAWQREGAKKLAVDISTEVTAKINERLNDSDNPATLEEIDGLVESIFRAHVMDKDGKLLDFGTPEAKTILGNALRETRDAILPQAQAAIKKQTDARFLSTWANNSVHEFYRGAPIGAAIKVEVGSTDPLAPLPEGGTPPVDTSQPYYAPHDGRVLEPFKGFHGATPTSRIGAPRKGHTHNGEDYAAPEGTSIVAPMSGEVVASFRNAAGGNQVRVRMADGAIVGFAHLSKRDVKQGDRVNAGDLLGLSGNTGTSTGPHVHVTVEVGGRKVSAKQYFATAKAPSRLPSGPALVSNPDDPELVTAPPADVVPAQLAPFDFEKAMANVPPGIAKADAKGFLVQSLINEATERGDVGLLQGLEDSKRQDGTPTFSPKEVETILAAREQISEKVRIKADRAEKELWERNSDTLLTAFIDGDPPSDGFIVDAAKRRLIDPSFAYTLIQHKEAERKEAEREAKADAREAAAEADSGIDATVNSIVIEKTSGDLSGAGADELLKSGQLGQGKKALARYRTIKAAERAGQKQLESDPEVARYAATIKQLYAPQAGKASLLERSRGVGGDKGNLVVYSTIMQAYRNGVRAGKSPGEAYLEAITKYAPKNDINRQDAIEARIRALRAQRQAAGR